MLPRHVSAVHPNFVTGMREMSTLFGAFLLLGERGASNHATSSTNGVN